MKSLYFLIAAALLILASRISFDLGQQSSQQKFADFCSSPGVLCTIRVGDLYLSSHGGEIDMLPLVTYEMRPDHGTPEGGEQ